MYTMYLKIHTIYRISNMLCNLNFSLGYEQRENNFVYLFMWIDLFLKSD